MTRITFLSPDRKVVGAVQAMPGQSVMKAALAADVRGIEAECGGSMTCATCHVYVSDRHAAQIPAPSDEEKTMLEFVAAERRPTSRLSCQIVARADLAELEVELPRLQFA